MRAGTTASGWIRNRLARRACSCDHVESTTASPQRPTTPTPKPKGAGILKETVSQGVGRPAKGAHDRLAA